MTTHTIPTDALAGAAQSTSDDDSVRRALVDGLRTRVAILRGLSLPCALHERAQVVAFGADTAHARLTEELRTLYRHAGLLLEAATVPTCPTCDGDVAHPGVEPCTDCGTVCVHDPGCRESTESCAARDARADREYAWWVEQQDRRRKGGE